MPFSLATFPAVYIVVELHTAAHAVCALTACTGATVSTVVDNAAPSAVLKEPRVKLDHVVDFFTGMDGLQVEWHRYRRPRRRPGRGFFEQPRAHSRITHRLGVMTRNVFIEVLKCGEYQSAMTTLSSAFGRYAHAIT